MSAVRPLHGTAVDLPAGGQGENAHAGCPVSGGRTWTPVATTAQLSGDGPFALSAEGIDIVAVRTAGGLRAFEGRCPHQGALLGEGELEGGEIVCRNHRWRFDAETGARRGETQCLRACPIAVRGEQVYVDTQSLKRSASFIRSKTRSIATLPAPRGLPLVGNAFDLDATRLHAVLEQWAERFGPLYRLRLAAQEVVVVSDPALAQRILLNRPETYRRVSNTELIAQEIGLPGIFSAEGAAWRPLRRLTMQALSHQNVRAFYPTLRVVAERLRTRWEKAADAKMPIDPAEDLRRFAADVTMQIAFGHDARTLEGDGDILRRELELVFPFVARRMKAVIPYWRVVRLPADRRLDRALDHVRKWLSQLVDSTRVRLAADSSRAANPANLLEAMLVARDEGGRPMQNEAILGNLIQVLLAGEDTTANTLAWAVHELCDQPEVVDALSGEVDRVLEGDRVPGSLETADRLVYAGAIAQETMRLRPVVPILFMEANVDTALGDLAVPQGTVIWVLSRPGATSEKAFARPREYSPERWLRGDAAGRAFGDHMPFGSGPRTCPGRPLALLEMRVVLATMYRNFAVERIGRREHVTERFAFALHPEGLRVRLRRR